MYTRQDIELDGIGSSFENQFIPYFTGFAGDFFGLTFTNYVTYTGANHGKLIFSSNGIDGQIDTQSEESIIGGSVAKIYGKFALGISANLAIRSARAYASFYGDSGGTPTLTTVNSYTKMLIINSLASASYKEGPHFFNLGVTFPGIKYSGSNDLKKVEQNGANPTSVTNEKSHPDFESTSGINFGYSYLSGGWTPSIDIFYNTDNDIINLNFSDSEERSNYTSDINLKFGLSTPEYRMERFYKGTTYSFLLGAQYHEVESQVDETEPIERTKTYQYSVGVKLTNRKTSPIFGVYYQNDQGLSRSTAWALMYSSNYNIFD